MILIGEIRCYELGRLKKKRKGKEGVGVVEGKDVLKDCRESMFEKRFLERGIF